MKMKMLLVTTVAFSLGSTGAFAAAIQNTDPNQVAVDVSSGAISQTVILQPGDRYTEGDSSFAVDGNAVDAKGNDVFIVKNGKVVNPRDSKQLRGAVAKVDTDLVPPEAIPDVASTPTETRDRDKGDGRVPHLRKPHIKPNPNKAAKARLPKVKKNPAGDGAAGT